MKKTLYSAVVLMLIVAFAGSAFAQDKDKDEIAPITRSGSAAALLSFGGIGYFGVYGPTANGSGDPRVTAGIGAKYFIMDRWALKGLLSFGSRSSGQDSSLNKFTGFGLGVGIEYHCHDLYGISPYWGGGIGFSTGTTEFGPGITGIVPSTHKSSNVSPQAATVGSTTVKSTGIAASLIAGFDWFFVRGIALGSEFSFGYATISNSTTSASGTTTDLPSSSQFGISGGSNVHLVVYF